MLLCIVYAMLFIDTVDTSVCVILYMLTLSTLGISIYNAFNAMYVNTVDINDIHICAHNFLNI